MGEVHSFLRTVIIQWLPLPFETLRCQFPIQFPLGSMSFFPILLFRKETAAGALPEARDAPMESADVFEAYAPPTPP